MKMETSKKLLWLNHVIFYVLITLVIICTFAGIECSNLTTVTSCVAVEVGAATSFYYSMNKKLNLPKIIKHICLSVIKNIEKRKGAHGSVFMRMKDHGMV